MATLRSMKISRFYLIALLGVLTSCTRLDILTIKAQVQTELPDGPLCRGSMQGRIVYAGGVLYDSGRVPYGENVETFIDQRDDPIPPTAQVQLEAWCYSVDGAEIGYAKLVGPFGDIPGSTPYVIFGNRLWSEPDSGCREPTESRGQPPCVYF